MIQKGKKKYLNRFICMVMGGWVRDGSYGCLTIVKIERQLTGVIFERSECMCVHVS